MAGIGAALTTRSDQTPGPEAALAALSEALAPRGPEAASRRAGAVELLIRAGIPAVHEAAGATLVIDGIAEASTLATRYAQLGASGLISGADPYALICADPGRDAMVLARNGDGPPLYYAVTPTRVLAASEPAALLAAGVPAQPDTAVVDRFIATGGCDDTEYTFFAGIYRVLPGQVVEVTRRTRQSEPFAVRTHRIRAGDGAGVSAQLALRWATLSGRVGVRLGGGLAGAAVLGAALGSADRTRPLPVYSATFPGLSGAAAEYAVALLGPLPIGAMRHRALPFFADEIDLDALLIDLGEPLPDLTGYVLWATARATAGEVDALVDAATGAALPRLADRVASRYGVALRFPFLDMTSTGDALRAELTPIIERMLPPSAAACAATSEDHAVEPPVRELLVRMRGELLTTFLQPRYGEERALLADFEALVGGRRVDAGRLFRRYAVQRWLRCVVEPAAARQRPAARRPASNVAVKPVAHDGVQWTRQPVTTEAFATGDKIAEKLAWYVAEQAAALGANLRGPWYALVAAKPVAVAQGRARCVWDVRPGWLARRVSRFAGRQTGLSTPWAAQVAIEVGGPVRLVAAATCARLGWPGWYARLAGPGVRSVAGPREDAVPPATIAVIPPPADPDRVAADVVAALRTALAGEAYASLAGCAIVGASDVDCRVLGWAAHAATGPAAADRPAGLIEALCADNPFGQGAARTPVVLAVRAPRRGPDRSPGTRPSSGRRNKNGRKR
ncbi:MAG TPA: hypothetical protein VFE14_16570 [Micromonosporaceae bacterium]|jgi:hypothetical protein|nr:hypothetical protein [Micromonosporaceae bacterium]